jgi:Predicted membrane protein (DUF2142)
VRVRVALLLGLGLSAIAGAIVLSGAPASVRSSNGVPLEVRLARTEGPDTVCQSAESLPRETSAIRLSLEAAIGPKVIVEVFSHRRLIAGGVRGAGWTAASVTVPVKPLRQALSRTTLCFAIARSRVHLAVIGAHVHGSEWATSTAQGHLPGRMRTEYLTAGHASWWSLAASVAKHMGFGRARASAWVAPLVLALMLALTGLASWLILCEADAEGTRATPSRREGSRRFQGSWLPRLYRRLPPAAWGCALAACVNAVCWSLITPAFQVPDERSHFAYVQLLAENGRLPKEGLPELSPALKAALQGLHAQEISFNPGRRALASEAQQHELQRDLAAPFSARGPGGAGAASSEPPLYYSLESVPYLLGSGGSLLDSLQLMRLLSAAMAAITALFAYLFVREALPGWRWAWSVGGLGVALFPLLGFISGGVNPDAMLFAVCAALYYLLARAFRRGMDATLAILIGATIAVGLLTKLNFIGFAPGVILGLVIVALRTARRAASSGRAGAERHYRPAAIAMAIAASPVLLYLIANLLSHRPALGFASLALNDQHGSWSDELSYVWQFYLPRLPGTPNYFPAISSTTRQLWFNGLVGFYGWADTLMPGWVYDAALVPFLAIAVLCVRELARMRVALRRRVAELWVYGATGAGVLILVGIQSYDSDVRQGFEPFWEPRYLLPMLPLWGCILALAARGAGRRWGPAVGAVLVTLFLAHDVFSQLQVIARYYG